MGHGITHSLLKFPILLVVGIILLVEVVLYALLRIIVSFYENIVSHYFTCSKNRQLHYELTHANTFEEFENAARELDAIEGRNKWKERPSYGHADYDYTLINEWIDTLKHQRNAQDYKSLMRTLQSIFASDNPAGINNDSLYNQTHFGTKQLINDFIAVVLECLVVIRDTEEIDLTERLSFFKRARQSYGRTALLLSGGAALGYFHVGVIKALHHAKLLPQVMAGASAGALMSSFVGVRTDEELERDLLTPDSYKYFTACEEPKYVLFWRYIRTSFTTKPSKAQLAAKRREEEQSEDEETDCWKKTKDILYNITRIRKVQGHMFDVERWEKAMKAVTMGNTTFAEAYAKTGRIINVSLTPAHSNSPPVILNYRPSPDVIIWSAVLASAAFPGVIQPVSIRWRDPNTGEIKPLLIHGSRWADGSLKADIPTKQIAKSWNAHHLIVSQTNPHALPFFYNTGTTGRSNIHKHGSGLRGGFIMNALEKLLKSDMKKWIALLGELNLLPQFLGADWRVIFTQPLTGDITIVPRANPLHFMRVITDPNRERMEDYIIRGERAVWPSLVRISNHVRFEKMLSQSYDMLRHIQLQRVEKNMGVSINNLQVNAGNDATLLFDSDNYTADTSSDASSERSDASPIRTLSQASNTKTANGSNGVPKSRRTRRPPRKNSGQHVSISTQTDSHKG